MSHAQLRRRTTVVTSKSSSTSRIALKSLTRGSAALAMSSGLVASFALPAVADVSTAQVSAPRALAAVKASHTSQAVKAPAAPVVIDRSRSLGGRAKPVARTSGAQRSGNARAASLQPATRAAEQGLKEGAPKASSNVLSTARRYLGVPYVFGGRTPRGWDCSGAVQYIYARHGVSLPRSSRAQYSATKRVSRDQARPGDLVFFFRNGSIYHVGIYAGNGKMYDSGRTGRSFSLRSLFSSNVAFGRL